MSIPKTHYWQNACSTPVGQKQAVTARSLWALMPDRLGSLQLVSQPRRVAEMPRGEARSCEPCYVVKEGEKYRCIRNVTIKKSDNGAWLSRNLNIAEFNTQIPRI